MQGYHKDLQRPDPHSQKGSAKQQGGQSAGIIPPAVMDNTHVLSEAKAQLSTQSCSCTFVCPVPFLLFLEQQHVLLRTQLIYNIQFPIVAQAFPWRQSLTPAQEGQALWRETGKGPTSRRPLQHKPIPLVCKQLEDIPLVDTIATIVKAITPQFKYIRYTSFCHEVSRV